MAPCAPWPRAWREAARRCFSTPTMPPRCCTRWVSSPTCTPCIGPPIWRTFSSNLQDAKSGRTHEPSFSPISREYAMTTLSPPAEPTLQPCTWRAPILSLRFWPVFQRSLLVWGKLAIPSLVGNIAEPLMWLVAFGYGMGALVGHVNVVGAQGAQQVPYILFLASGAICMSAMQAASFEALYSAFSRMHVQKDLGQHPE